MDIQESPKLEVFGAQPTPPGSQTYDISSNLYLSVISKTRPTSVLWEIKKDGNDVGTQITRSNTLFPQFSGPGNYLVRATGSLDTEAGSCQFFSTNSFIQILNQACSQASTKPTISFSPNKNTFTKGESLSLSVSNISQYKASSVKWTLEYDAQSNGSFVTRHTHNGSSLNLSDTNGQIDDIGNYRVKVEALPNSTDPNCTYMISSTYSSFVVGLSGDTSPRVLDIEVTPGQPGKISHPGPYEFWFQRNQSQNSVVKFTTANVEKCFTKFSAANFTEQSNLSSCLNWDILKYANDTQQNCYYNDNIEMRFQGSNGQTLMDLKFYMYCPQGSTQCEFNNLEPGNTVPRSCSSNAAQITSATIENTTGTQGSFSTISRANPSTPHNMLLQISNSNSCSYYFDIDSPTTLNSVQACSSIAGLNSKLGTTQCRLTKFYYTAFGNNGDQANKYMFVYCPENSNSCIYGNLSDWDPNQHSCSNNSGSCTNNTSGNVEIWHNGAQLFFGTRSTQYKLNGVNRAKSFKVANNLSLEENQNSYIGVRVRNLPSSSLPGSEVCTWSGPEGYALGVGGTDEALYSGQQQSVTSLPILTENTISWGLNNNYVAPGDFYEFQITLKAPFISDQEQYFPQLTDKVYLPLNFQMYQNTGNKQWFGNQVELLGASTYSAYIEVNKRPRQASEYCQESVEGPPLHSCELPTTDYGQTASGNCGNGFNQPGISWSGNCSYRCDGNNTWTLVNNTCEMHIDHHQCNLSTSGFGTTLIGCEEPM